MILVTPFESLFKVVVAESQAITFTAPAGFPEIKFEVI